MPEVICKQCGELTHKSPRQAKVSKLLFCDRECYLTYRKENDYYPNRGNKARNKLFELGKIRKQKLESIG